MIGFLVFQTWEIDFCGEVAPRNEMECPVRVEDLVDGVLALFWEVELPDRGPRMTVKLSVEMYGGSTLFLHVVGPLTVGS
jgi:hypothetical protein